MAFTYKHCFLVLFVISFSAAFFMMSLLKISAFRNILFNNEMGVNPTSPYNVTERKKTSVNTTEIQSAFSNKSMKIISLHRWDNSRWFSFPSPDNAMFSKCPINRCEFDQNGKKQAKADLLFFLCKDMQTPPPRSAGQLWAVGCWESSVHWRFPDDPRWTSAFNLTISYRVDADAFSPYNKLTYRDPSTLLTTQQYEAIARSKHKTAMWIVSNCQADRMNFVKRMQKYIDVDIYGSCGNFKCQGRDCFGIMKAQYKFYLAFENSFCKDYVTEKLFKVYRGRLHTLPVTKGGVDYDARFPSSGLVNGNKFETAENLALYLKELAGDIPRYAKMLAEQDTLVSVNDDLVPASDWCQICAKLHNPGFHHIYDNVRQWSHANDCKASGYKLTRP